MKSKSKETKPSIVFCHGIWADGSCFQVPDECDRLRNDALRQAQRVVGSARAAYP